MREELLNILRTNPRSSFPTSELVRRTYPDTYPELLNKQENGTAEQQKQARREKAKLHRKILYHLRRLQDDESIRVVRRTQAGEKIFAFNNDDTPNPTKDFDLSLNQPASGRSTAIQNSNQSYAAVSHEAATDPGVDAVLVDAASHTPTELHNTVAKLTGIVEDLVAITNIHTYLETYATADLISLLTDLNTVSSQNNCYICTRLNLNETQPQPGVKTFIEAFYKHTGSSIKLVCAADYQENKHEIYENILYEAQRTKRKAHFEFTNVTPQPVFTGENGPYTVPLKAWERLGEKDTASVTCLCHNTYSIDINSFMNEHSSITRLRQLILDAAKHMYLKTTETRSDITLALKNYFDKPHSFYADFFSTTQNYIRYWNYTWDDQHTVSFESFKTLIDTVTEQTRSLAQKQTTIFQACGIPLHAHITHAPAFSTGIPKTFTERAYQKQTLYNLSELSQDHWQQFLTHREETARMFTYADRTRIFRSPETQPESLVAEIKHLHKNHALPLLCYDFQRLTKERQLHDYL